MTTRRRRLLLFVLFVLLAGSLPVGVGIWLLWPRTTAITPENAAKIKVGMVPEEVMTILDGAERNESSGPLALPTSPADQLMFRVYPEDQWPQSKVWVTDNLVILVRFNMDRQVEACDCLDVQRCQESPINLLRRLLEL